MKLNGKTFAFVVGAIILALVLGTIINVGLMEGRLKMRKKLSEKPAAATPQKTVIQTEE